MRLALLVPLVIGPLLQVACKNTSAPPTSPNQPSSGGQSHTPNPLTVTERQDSTHSAVAVIDTAGGSVSATGADGVTYTLTIPADALTLSEQITLTPVPDISGLPLHGGLLGAVHIEPSGIQLLKPVILTLGGVKPAPSGNAPVGFTYQGTGAEFHLLWAVIGQTITFQLVHFSGVGVGGGSQQDLNDQAQRAPTNSAAQFAQDVAMLLYAQPPVTDLPSKVQALLDTYEKNLETEMNAAVAEGATIEQFLQAYDDVTSFSREAQLVGANTPAVDALLGKWFGALPTVFKNQINACFNQHDVQAGLVALSLLRHALLNGIEGLSQDAVARCLTFKLDFDVQLHSSVQPVGETTARLTATGAQWALFSGVEGSTPAPLVYVTYDLSPQPAPPCGSQTGTSVSAPFYFLRINGLSVKRDSTGKIILGAPWVVDIMPGSASETVTTTCPPPVSPVISTSTYYNDNWKKLHADEHILQKCEVNQVGCIPDFYRIPAWSVQNGQHLFAQKTYNRLRTYANVTVLEQTTLKLYHEPLGSGIP